MLQDNSKDIDILIRDLNLTTGDNWNPTWIELSIRNSEKLDEISLELNIDIRNHKLDRLIKD